MCKAGGEKVCPWWLNFMVDNPVRRMFFRADKLLGSYLEKGMVFLDLGCGGGRYSIAGAELLGTSGRVIALDIQEQMLAKVEREIGKRSLEKVVKTHLGKQNNIDLNIDVDFALAMCMVHETQNKYEFFTQVKKVLKNGGKMLVVEPKGHVSRKKVEEQIENAKRAGLKLIELKRINIFCRGYLLKK